MHRPTGNRNEKPGPDALADAHAGSKLRGRRDQTGRGQGVRPRNKSFRMTRSVQLLLHGGVRGVRRGQGVRPRNKSFRMTRSGPTLPPGSSTACGVSHQGVQGSAPRGSKGVKGGQGVRPKGGSRGGQGGVKGGARGGQGGGRGSDLGPSRSGMTRSVQTLPPGSSTACGVSHQGVQGSDQGVQGGQGGSRGQT